MAGQDPQSRRLANEELPLTDYYAEAELHHRAAKLITAELPLRTGLTTVGQRDAARHPPSRHDRAVSRTWDTATRPFARTTSAIEHTR